MNYSSRFFLYAPLTLFLLLAAGAGGYWWVVAGALSTKLDAMNGHEAVPGVTLRFAKKTVSGFPFNLDVVFDDVTLTTDTPHGPASWTTEKFALHGLTYGREQFIFEAAGRQMLRWHDLKGGAHAMPFAVGDLHASSIVRDRGLVRLDIDLAAFGSPSLAAGRVQLHARRTPNGRGLDIFASADGVRLSPELGSLFGAELREAHVNATAVPATAFDGLRAGRTDWVSALETWRQAGGTVTVNDAEIAWSGTSAKGKGTLSLDANHAVRGLLDFKIAGIASYVADARRRNLHGGMEAGLGAALLDRAAAAGSDETGLTGVVIGFENGVVTLGGEAATTEEPLY